MARAGQRQQAAVAGVRGRGAPRRLARPLRRGRLGGLLLDRRRLARDGGGRPQAALLRRRSALRSSLAPGSAPSQGARPPGHARGTTRNAGVTARRRTGSGLRRGHGRSSRAWFSVPRRRCACPTWQWLPARSPDDSARDAARQPRARPAPGAASHLTAAQASCSPSLQPVPASGLRRISARCRHGRGGGESGACSSGSSSAARGRRPSRLLGARAAAAGPPAPCCRGAMAALGAPPPAAAAAGAPAAALALRLPLCDAPRSACDGARRRRRERGRRRPAGMQHCVHVSGGPSPAAGACE